MQERLVEILSAFDRQPNQFKWDTVVWERENLAETEGFERRKTIAQI
jgi:hypothetical protein